MYGLQSALDQPNTGVHQPMSFPLLINGTQSDTFIPQRGLRQGDPLSPYIFLICQNVLSLMFLEAKTHKKIDGIKLSRGSPPISHLLFADDCFIFFRTNVRAFRAIKQILKEFYWLWGQNINCNKSELFVSPNWTHLKRRWFGGILGRKCTSKPSKYLGIKIRAMN